MFAVFFCIEFNFFCNSFRETALRRAEEQKQRMLEEAKQRKAKEFKERMEMVKREREKAKEELMQVSKPMVVEKFVCEF